MEFVVSSSEDLQSFIEEIEKLLRQVIKWSNFQFLIWITYLQFLFELIFIFFCRFNQPFLIQSNNASLSLRFRMDPASGTDQVIEGAFAYYNGLFPYTISSHSEFRNLIQNPSIKKKINRHRRFQTSRIALWRHLQSGIESTAGASDSFLWFDHILVDCRPVQLHLNIHTWREEERHSDCNHLTEAFYAVYDPRDNVQSLSLVFSRCHLGDIESNERQPAVLHGMWPARMPLSYKSHIYRQSRHYFNVEPDSTLSVRRYQGEA